MGPVKVTGVCCCVAAAPIPLHVCMAPINTMDFVVDGHVSAVGHFGIPTDYWRSGSMRAGEKE